MTQIPSLSYRQVVNALQRAGFVVVRQGVAISAFRKEPENGYSS